MERYGPLVGRALLSVVFILSGIGKITDPSRTASYMAENGMPAVRVFLAMAILVEIGGGLSVLIGLRARIGAAALALFLISVTLIFHDFWAYQGMEQRLQMTNFLKNLAIMGGLTLVIAHGSGPLSVDAGRQPQ